MTKCPRCDDTGLADSGGTYPWGEWIMIPCDCKEEESVSPLTRLDVKEPSKKQKSKIEAIINREDEPKDMNFVISKFIKE